MRPICLLKEDIDLLLYNLISKCSKRLRLYMNITKIFFRGSPWHTPTRLQSYVSSCLSLLQSFRSETCLILVSELQINKMKFSIIFSADEQQGNGYVPMFSHRHRHWEDTGNYTVTLSKGHKCAELTKVVKLLP